MLRNLDVLGPSLHMLSRILVSSDYFHRKPSCVAVCIRENSVFRGSEKIFLITIKDIYLIFMIKTILPTLEVRKMKLPLIMLP